MTEQFHPADEFLRQVWDRTRYHPEAPMAAHELGWSDDWGELEGVLRGYFRAIVVATLAVRAKGLGG